MEKSQGISIGHVILVTKAWTHNKRFIVLKNYFLILNKLNNPQNLHYFITLIQFQNSIIYYQFY